MNFSTPFTFPAGWLSGVKKYFGCTARNFSHLLASPDLLSDRLGKLEAKKTKIEAVMA